MLGGVNRVLVLIGVAISSFNLSNPNCVLFRALLLFLLSEEKIKFLKRIPSVSNSSSCLLLIELEYEQPEVYKSVQLS